MAKTIICHCEDITLEDLYSALEQGYAEIESLKRFTGIGTGKCQGKCCLVQSLRVLNQKRGSALPADGVAAGPGSTLDPESGMDPGSLVHIPTIRQPVIPLKINDIWPAIDADPPLESGRESEK